jgi:hypothetical protein
MFAAILTECSAFFLYTWFQVNQDTPLDQPPQLLAPAQLRQLQTDTPVHI